MIAYVKGSLVESQAAFAVVESQGIGYKIWISLSCFAKLPETGQQVKLFTSFIVRENSQALYGFMTERERELFEGLLQISGIGPKLAMNIVGHLTPVELHQAIGRADVKTISRVPGIGKKMAERMIVELRDKVPLHEEGVTTSPLLFDLIGALTHLGYSGTSAREAAKKVLDKESEERDLATLIREALKYART